MFRILSIVVPLLSILWLQTFGTVNLYAAALEGKSYRVVFNEDNGAIEYVLNKRTNKKIVQAEGQNTLWTIEYIDKTILSSSEFSSAYEEKKFSLHCKENSITMVYQWQDFSTTVEFTAGQESFDGKVTLANPPKVVLTLNFPHQLSFAINEINRFYFPHNLGIALKQRFYTLGKGYTSREFGLQQKNVIEGHYPDNFSDFVYLDSNDGAMAVYGIQDESEIFVPAKYKTGYDDWQGGSGFYDHSFVTYVDEQQTWTSPIVRIEIGTVSYRFGTNQSLIHSLQNYSKANGFTTLLDDKMPSDMLEKFKKSMLLFYNGKSYNEMSEGLDLIPSPSLIHFTNYLRVGFDRNYPDHLPPNPAFGTPEEFRNFYDRAHEKGMLVMPYTNPTWWCDYPESPAPSVVKYGDAPLSRDLNGELYVEKYWINSGWSLTFNHPIAQQVRRRDVKLLTEKYPSDILLQDQVGARGYKYDTNPACPVPYAYTQGLIDMVKEDSKTVPLSTEDGFDRLLNYEIQFCGCTWHIPMWGKEARNWQYHHLFGSELFEIFPFVHIFAHDKVAFTHHDLAVFITDRSTLRWSLALGYQMTYRTNPDGLRNPKTMEWIRWLDLIQKNIAYHYIGKKMISFEYISEGVSQTAFQGGPTIIANHLDLPYRVNESMVIAPRGFFAQGNNNLLGTFYEYDKEPLDKEKWIIKIGAGDEAKLYYYFPPLDMY